MDDPNNTRSYQSTDPRYLPPISNEDSTTDNVFESFTLAVKENIRNLIRDRLPILTWLPMYSFSAFSCDILAGVSVAMTEIPQGIAFAAIAGLPLEYGLYSGFMGCFVYLFMGSCKDTNIGPTSILALMIQQHVFRMGIDMAVLITFLTGLTILLLGLLHLGYIVNFFSYPITAGFTSAAALTIASSQIKSLFGISGRAAGFLNAWWSVFSNLDQIRKWDTILGVATIAFLIILKELQGAVGTLKYRPDWSSRRNFLGRTIFILSLARNALAVLFGSVLAYSLESKSNMVLPFRITGNVSNGFPPLSFPPFSTDFNGTHYEFRDMLHEYGTSLVFVPLVAILETIAIGKAFSSGRKLDATQEILTLGVCNLLGSFVRSMPVTGSFTRTAVNNASGVRTPAAGVITAVLVLLALTYLTKTFYYIPKATLAAVVISAMFYLFDYKAFSLLWRSYRLDLVPFLITLLCGTFLSLEYGIIVGVAAHLLVILYKSARPELVVNAVRNNVFVVRPKDTINYSAAERVRDGILDCDAGYGAIIIVDGINLESVDSTVAKVFSVLSNELTVRSQRILFINFKEELRKVCLAIDPNLSRDFTGHTLDEIIVRVGS